MNSEKYGVENKISVRKDVRQRSDWATLVSKFKIMSL